MENPEPAPGSFLSNQTQTDTDRFFASAGITAEQSIDGVNDPVQYHHGDLVASMMLTTDDAGAASADLAYTAFGEPLGDPTLLEPRYQYAGGWGYETGLLELQGPNTGLAPLTLQHVGHRWYQPDIGRFVQRDPIGIVGGLNVYLYVGGNPLNAVDPTGLWHPNQPGAPPPITFDPGPAVAKVVIWVTGGKDSWLDNKPLVNKIVRTSQGLVLGVAVTCVAPWYAGAGATLWAGSRVFGASTGSTAVDEWLDGASLGVGGAGLTKLGSSVGKGVIRGWPGSSNPPYLRP